MKKDQQDKGLAFNGQADIPMQKYNSKYQHNQSGLTAKGNYGRGPTVAGSTGDTVPNPTASVGRINGGASVKAAKGNYGRGPTKGNSCC